MRTLVLGGSVFVGRHLVGHLCEDGHEVTVLNRGLTPTELAPGVTRLVADRTDLTAMRAALGRQEWDAVFDVSGFVMAAGGGDIGGGAIGGGGIGDVVDLFGDRTGRYVYVSSVMAYDQGLLGVVPWTEGMATNPGAASTYGGFKARVEAELLARWEDRRFPATIVRPAAIYGPDNNIYDMETPMWLRLRQRRPILLPHGGLVTGSYGHVDDLCRAMLLLATAPAALGQVFNITAEAVTSRHYVEVLAEIVGVEPVMVELPDGDLAALDRAPFGHLFGAAHHAVLSTDKARRLLGWEAPTDFRTGHAATFDWFLAQGWDRLEAPLQDSTWHASWDFEWEAEVARQLQSKIL